jgi:chromosome segregation ATPase
LQRFSQLNRDYRELTEAHRGCGDISDRLKEVEEERDARVASHDKLLKEFRALEDEVSAASTRQEGLVEQLEEMEKDKNEWRSTTSSQAAKIKEL